MPASIAYPPRSRAAFGTSVFLHATATVFVALSGGSMLQSPAPQRTALVLAPTPASDPPPKISRPLPAPRPRKPLTAPRALRIPRPSQPVLLPPAPAIEPALRTEETSLVPLPTNPRPEPPVRTGSFEPQKAVRTTRVAGTAPVSRPTTFTPVAPVAIQAATRTANVGVFGVPAAGPAAGRTARLQVPVGTAFGSPDVSAAAPASRQPVGRTDAFSEASAPDRAPHGAGRPVQAGGFADSAAPPPPRPEPKPAMPRAGGFTEVVAAPGKAIQPGGSEAPPAAKPVEILEKPRPAYTEEARRLRIEGDVLLEILFSASGEIRVGRIVQSLGHGLDEAALAAARTIKFRPAIRDGKPVDTTATVRIVFQLAF